MCVHHSEVVCVKPFRFAVSSYLYLVLFPLYIFKYIHFHIHSCVFKSLLLVTYSFYQSPLELPMIIHYFLAFTLCEIMHKMFYTYQLIFIYTVISEVS